MTEPVTVDAIDEGTIWRIRFGRPPGNVLDIETLDALTTVFEAAGRSEPLRAMCLEGTGHEFSFGASIAEHLPTHVEAMLRAVQTMVFALVESRVIVVAAVRGRCLGGGLELASLCHRVVAAEGASFGQPEIALGVFAPVASIVLEGRVGRGHAEDLCLTGRTVSASEALAIGLVDEVQPGDPSPAALAWIRGWVRNRSASGLRFAVAAVRTGLARRLHEELPRLERLYLDQLMTTGDPVEGLQAFLEKRPPRWKA